MMVEIAVAVAIGYAAGTLIAEAIRSWAVHATWAYAEWRAQRRLARIRREMEGRR